MKLINILLLLLPLYAYPATYYIATDGDNADPGTFAEPWATFTYAADNISGGDTVYFMGGTYYPTTQVEITSDINGTYGEHTAFLGYPGDTVIFDFVNYDEASNYAQAIFINTAGYLTFKNFEIKNVEQKQQYTEVTVIYSQNGHNLHFENISVHDCGGRGFMHETAVGYYGITSDTTFFINCDSYNNADSLQYTSGATLGNQSDGFKTYGEPGAYLVYRGCRAWNVSDDGYDLGNNATIIIDNCWSFQNGKILSGDGEGFKTGGLTVEETGIRRVIKNCIAAENDFSGFRLLDYEGYYRTNAKFYNNLSYKNYGSGGTGFSVDDNFDEPTILASWRNNIAYKNYYGGDPEMDMPFSNTYQTYTESNNAWELVEGYPGWEWNIEPTDADFVSLDVEELKNPRKADGSLPDVSFGKLVRTSNFINTGTTNITDIDNLPYVGAISYVGTPDIGYSEFQPIIADHTIVDLYDDIPQQWIDSVKTMWLSVPGESHSEAYRTGLESLEAIDEKFAVNITLSGTPEDATTNYLRASRATWGDVNNASGWIYDYGEEDWGMGSAYAYTLDPDAVARTKAGILYASENDLTISAFGFGHCYDDGVNLAYSYVEATKQYITFCNDSVPGTVVFFTTGPIDSYMASGAAGYEQYQKWEIVRDSVNNDETRILFDYADILSYNDAGELSTAEYDEHTFPVIHEDNLGGTYTGHIGSVGAIRLAKAMWWMLARMSGWDGVSTLSASPIDSSAHNITIFALTEQTGIATIDTANHTVSIEVEYGTTVTSLSPTITVSTGATISPTSGTATNFTSPVVYTVTALDESTQEWTVTVTVAAAPEVPMGRIGQGTDRRVQQGSAIRVIL